MNQEQLRSSFHQLDIEQCKSIATNAPFSQDRDQLVLKLLRESGCLMVQFPSAKRERRRNEMAKWLDEFLGKHPGSEIRAGYERHQRAARAAELGFREIAATRDRALIWALDSTVQAWSVIHRTVDEVETSDRQLMKAAGQVSNRTNYLDITQVRLPGMADTPISPDDLLESTVDHAGMTLKLLGHKEQWFDSDTGDLILPHEVTVTEEQKFKAGSHSYLARRWADLEVAWERSRWLDMQLDVMTEIVQDKNGPVEASVITGEDPDENDLIGQIAVGRLRDIFLQSWLPLLPQWKTLQGKVSSPSALANCEGCLTEWEFGAQYLLSSLFHWPLNDQTQTFGGLSLRAWIRGYSFLASIHKPKIEAFELDDLVKGLVAAGLSQQHARLFVSHATFGRSTRDLFDAPLLRVADSTYRIFSPALFAPSIANVVASRLASIRREWLLGRTAHEVAQFDRKGREFEKAMLKLLTDHGVKAASFAFRLRQTNYDCDLAAIIDDTLFVFDCKNYNLPMGRPSELSHWTAKLRESRRQVARIAKDLDDHPEILRQHLGNHIQWKRVVPCVLNALPWSQGKDADGVYVYDQSALTRMFESGQVRFLALGGTSKSVSGVGPALKLRSGDVPTADEIIRELEDPIQLRSQKPTWKVVNQFCAIGMNTGIRIPYWNEFPLGTEERITAMGFSPDDQRRMMSQLSKPPNDSSMMAVALANAARLPTQAPTKQGRNDACRCGSGRKYKKCCGRVG